MKKAPKNILLLILCKGKVTAGQPGIINETFSSVHSFIDEKLSLYLRPCLKKNSILFIPKELLVKLNSSFLIP